MKPIRCILIEDEKPILDELRYLLEPYEALEIIGEAENGIKGLEMIKALKPDVVFLDVSMPQLSGVAMAEQLKFLNNKPDLVFTTAFSEHAVDAFNLGAVDYLLKPYDESRIAVCVERLKNRHRDSAFINGSPKDAELHHDQSIKRLPGIHCEKTILIDMADVLYVSAEKDKMVIHTKQGDFNCALTLNEIVARTSLFRVHRSYAVNLAYIHEIYPWFNGTYEISFKDSDQKIIVSRNYVKALKKVLML